MTASRGTSLIPRRGPGAAQTFITTGMIMGRRR
jgi:hypothetical protein